MRKQAVIPYAYDKYLSIYFVQGSVPQRDDVEKNKAKPNMYRLEALNPNF